MRRVRTAALGCALGLSLVGGETSTARAAAPQPPSTATPADPSAPAPAPAPATATDDDGPTTTDGPAVLSGVLPSGLRVVVGQDGSLPVAAVVLAIETGTEDDPSAQPGLIHALAYHLLQGNRELAPGAAAAIVHDAGGLASLAVGPGQVRFESLVPVSRLEATLWAESQRLRAPTVSEVLWADTVRWARRNKARAWSVPMAAVAAAHEVPALDHVGHRVGPEITDMAPRAIGAALAERFSYARATLAVVGPEAPDKTWQRVVAAFASLPAAARVVPRRLAPRDAAPRSATAPRKVAIPKVKGTRLVWPLPPDPGAYLHARVWCKALNRQRRVPEEGKRARVRCRMERDPRRGVVIVRGSGVDDPLALIAARLTRLDDGTDAALVERQRRIVLAEDEAELRTPLALARRLSETVGYADTTQRAATPRAEAVGHGPLAPGTPTAFAASLSLPQAVLLVPDDAPAGSDSQTAKDASPVASPDSSPEDQPAAASPAAPPPAETSEGRS